MERGSGWKARGFPGFVCSDALSLVFSLHSSSVHGSTLYFRVEIKGLCIGLHSRNAHSELRTKEAVIRFFGFTKKKSIAKNLMEDEKVRYC